MSSSSLAVLGFLLLSAPVLAGDVYSFTVEQSDDTAPAGKLTADPGGTKGKVIVDSRKYRVELAPDPKSSRPYEVLISNDGGDREIALSLHDHRYFEPKKAEITSSLFHLLPIPGDRSVSRVEMTALAQPEEVSGVPSQRHEIKLSYDITLVIPPPANMPPGKGSAETVRGKVSVDAVYWLAEGETPVLPHLLQPALHTGFPEVDAKLDRAMAALQGIPVKQQVTISITGDKGTESRTTTRTVTLENHKRRETKAALFEIPAGFKMHEPEVSRPAMRVVPD
jgi:hypothetical protein